MTKQEICKEYREAKNKSQQIEILADLNLCTKEDIVKLLKDEGEEVAVRKPRKQRQQKKVVAPVINTSIPDFVLDALYEKLERIDREIKEKEKDYKRIVVFIQSNGGKVGEEK